MKKENQKIEEEAVSRDRQTVVLEDMNSRLALMLEQFSGLHKKIDKNHQEFLGFRDQTNENFKKIGEFRKETGENFSVVMEYLTRIDDEIQDMKKELKILRETLKEKADLDKLAGFEKRLLRVEKILQARMA